jgi:hypothetical protein
VRAFLAFPLAALVLAAGCITPAAPQEEDGPPPSDPRNPDSPDFKPIVTIAVIDTGINPYHEEFRELYDDADPATYLPGYPADVKVLNLTLDASLSGGNRPSVDGAIWESTQARTLYRVEGTKIVGLISFGGSLPGAGHGTMTASRAVGNTISIGGPDVRVVVVVGFNAEAIRWAADQSWIDIMSISSGVTANVLVPFAGNVLDREVKDAFQYAAHKKPFFASSGNGVGNAGLLGYPSWSRGASGVPDVISVGANDNGKVSRWHNQDSYIVGDGCGNPSAADGDTARIANTGGGTSSATPFSAGGGGAMLLEARRLLGDNHTGPRASDAPVPSFGGWSSGRAGDAKVILAQGDPSRAGITSGPLADGVLTLQEFKDVLYHTALEQPTADPSDGNACVVLAGGELDAGTLPQPVRFRLQGYGEVNGKSIESAKRVLRGELPNPQRAADDQSYANVYLIKSTVNS